MTEMQQTKRPTRCEKVPDAEMMRRVREINDRIFTETGSRPAAYVLTFGCQQNEADSEHIAGMCRDMGYAVTESAEEAALIMVNTCAIREHAEKKALSIVGQYKHLKAKNPSLIIGVCGCMVAQEHRREQLKHSYPYVDLVFGTTVLHAFPALLYEKIQSGRRRFYANPEDFVVPEEMPVIRGSGYRAWVSIMYGCNNFCSYCIVPYVRGRERSRRREMIVREVKELVNDGYRDITLLGQNVNSYAKGSDWGYDFADLLAELDAIEGDFTLRFMTSHPKDASSKLIDVMARGRHIAHHFHLPMQSGSDAILKQMNRHYDRARYLSIVRELREKIPDITLTSDIIVGFPGESEADFEDTLDMLRTVRFDMLYSFIYSARKGTPAATMEQLSPQVQGERFERLLSLQSEIAGSINADSVGRTLRVLCDGVSKNDDGVLSGRSDGNKIVFFHGDAKALTGCFVHVRIERAEPFALYGKIVE